METKQEQRNTRRDAVNKLKGLAYNAGRWTTFDPERLGERLLNGLEAELQQGEAQLPEELRAHFAEKYISLYSQWLAARGRCISSMITGPARFPVARAEKMNRYERSARERLDNWAENYIKRANRQKRLTGWAEIARLEDKVETLERLQETMKAANVVIRSKKSEEEKSDELCGLGLSEETVRDLLNPSGYYRGAGFRGFELSNNLANIKATRARLERLKAVQERGDSEEEVNGVRVEVCAAEERVRLHFDGKPAPEVIASLKANAFKWSPKNMAWQRQLTANAIAAAKRIVSGLAE